MLRPSGSLLLLLALLTQSVVIQHDYSIGASGEIEKPPEARVHVTMAVFTDCYGNEDFNKALTNLLLLLAMEFDIYVKVRLTASNDDVLIYTNSSAFTDQCDRVSNVPKFSDTFDVAMIFTNKLRNGNTHGWGLYLGKDPGCLLVKLDSAACTFSAAVGAHEALHTILGTMHVSRTFQNDKTPPQQYYYPTMHPSTVGTAGMHRFRRDDLLTMPEDFRYETHRNNHRRGSLNEQEVCASLRRQLGLNYCDTQVVSYTDAPQEPRRRANHEFKVCDRANKTHFCLFGLAYPLTWLAPIARSERTFWSRWRAVYPWLEERTARCLDLDPRGREVGPSLLSTCQSRKLQQVRFAAWPITSGLQKRPCPSSLQVKRNYFFTVTGSTDCFTKCASGEVIYTAFNQPDGLECRARDLSQGVCVNGVCVSLESRAYKAVPVETRRANANNIGAKEVIDLLKKSGLVRSFTITPFDVTDTVPGLDRFGARGGHCDTVCISNLLRSALVEPPYSLMPYRVRGRLEARVFPKNVRVRSAYENCQFLHTGPLLNCSELCLLTQQTNVIVLNRFECKALLVQKIALPDTDTDTDTDIATTTTTTGQRD